MSYHIKGLKKIIIIKLKKCVAGYPCLYTYIYSLDVAFKMALTKDQIQTLNHLGC